MPVPSQMFDHGLDGLKGWPHENALDFSAKLSDNVTIDPVHAGRVVHLNSVGEFEMGVSGHVMPLFLIPGSDHFDVANPGGNAWTPINPDGTLSALVATGAFELSSTEFNADLDYLPNDLLTATASNTNATTGGRLTNAAVVLYTTAVCGVVSRGAAPNSNGADALAFWPVYCPA